jgi:uncharacterized protein (DUF952 family)
VVTVANFIYRDWEAQLVLLEIDPTAVLAEIRVEGLDDSGDEYPHIYGELPVAAVRSTHLVSRDATGWSLPKPLAM